MGKKVKKTFSNIGSSLLGAGTGGLAGLAMSQLLKKKQVAAPEGAIEGAIEGATAGATPAADPANEALRATLGLLPVGATKRKVKNAIGVRKSNISAAAQLMEEKRKTLLGGATGGL